MVQSRSYTFKYLITLQIQYRPRNRVNLKVDSGPGGHFVCGTHRKELEQPRLGGGEVGKPRAGQAETQTRAKEEEPALLITGLRPRP